MRLTKSLRAHVELRLGFALGRFGDQIDRIAVHLSNSDERRDVGEKRCRIAVGLPRCVKVQETDADLFSAVARAADRMGRSVARAIEQERTRTPSNTHPWKDKQPKADAALPPASRRTAAILRAFALRQRYSSEPLRK
ncbi:MAG: HPF/RaiA family ribosome-associated protein [Deltaproteobacteria bacterium]|nr:HPF/RaiA family ribosome-associated protein [Deltaproteobacteria bacterium]